MTPPDIEQQIRKTYKEPRRLPLRQFVRRNLVISVFTFFYLAITVLIFYQINDASFDKEKKEVIDDLLERGLLFKDNTRNQLSDKVNEYISRSVSRSTNVSIQEDPNLQRIISEMNTLSDEMMENNPFVFEVSFKNAEGEYLVLKDDPKRIASQNDFSNSLFTFDFETRIASVRENNGIYAGSLEIRYTTPKNILAIEQVVFKWRIISVLIFISLLCFYIVMFYTVLLPIRRVMVALDKGAEIGARFITPSNMLLVKYYNNLARDATLSALSTMLRGYITEETMADKENLVSQIPELISSLFPINEVQIASYRKLDQESDYELASCYNTSVANGLEVFPKRIPKIFDSDRNHSKDFYSTVLLHDREYIVLYFNKQKLDVKCTPWWDEVMENISYEISFALEKIESQRRLILQEKNKANISLSRNLGHDLTNIIATSKLELMTVKSLLNMPREKVYESEVKREIFQESLESLLNSTRFLQETVNLYRSYTYLSRPRYENVEVGDLVQNVAHLFQLSLSKNISVEFQLDENLQEVVIEPRLLKLALFNLMSNAVDSIKLGSSAEQPSGKITLRTSLIDENTFQIDIQDSGTGIVDEDGSLLSEREIENIFQLGYTTKEQGTGEGLGLNWVKQIVTDFHEGSIKASNHNDGGAVFSLIMPVKASEPENLQPTDKSISGSIKLPGTNKIKSNKDKEQKAEGKKE